jgi:hypothetical protein
MQFAGYNKHDLTLNREAHARMAWRSENYDTSIQEYVNLCSSSKNCKFWKSYKRPGKGTLHWFLFCFGDHGEQAGGKVL